VTTPTRKITQRRTPAREREDPELDVPAEGDRVAALCAGGREGGLGALEGRKDVTPRRVRRRIGTLGHDLTLLACTSAVPLGDAPIVGGTPELRDRIAAAVEFFEGVTGAGRVELKEIRIVPGGGSTFGVYRHPSRTVDVAEDAAIGSVTRHLFCHALVEQSDMAKSQPAPMSQLADLLFDANDEYDDTNVDVCCASEERRWSEAVATACEFGPYWAADVVRDTCPPHPLQDDGDVEHQLARDVAAWMMDVVWRPFVLPQPFSVGSPVPVWASLPDDASVERVDGTADPGVIAVTLEGGDLRHFDLDDGAAVESDLSPLEREGIPTGLHICTPTSAWAGWPEGPAAMSGVWCPLPLPTTATRELVHDGDLWRFVGDGCGADIEMAFTAADTVWTASGNLMWSPVVERTPPGP
jgi:hypothetical protein